VTRLAVFVFSELAEVSATLESLGEARSPRSRRAYLELVRDAVGSAGGRELAVAGDGVLAAFDGVTDALSFADRVQRGCDREGRRAGERLDVRLGIEAGEAALDDPVEARRAAAATAAQRLARGAEAGSVLASSLVAALATASEARFRPAGLLELPGGGGPVSVVEVVWERAVVEQPPLPPELEAGVSHTLFVGRPSERERLFGVWQRALGGERQLAFVVGEPGIGKTRLVAEVGRALHEQGAVVLWGRSFEEALTPYQPFVQALQHYVRSVPPEQLRDQLGTGAAVVARLLPGLEQRVPVRLAPVEESESERYRLFEAIGRLLNYASTERPLVLVLDDLQWGDQATLLLLKHLTLDPAAAPLLLIGTYRDSEVGSDHPLALTKADIERDRIVERIELAGLDEDEVGALVGDLICCEPPVEAVRSLHEETQGNPFFLEEVVRHLEQQGICDDPERLAGVHVAVEELGVPARVRELVGRRARRLEPATQASLSAAAVIGSEFDRAVLADVLDAASPAHLIDVLDEAVQARLLIESPEHVGRYGFSHALVQQALYEEQTLNHRAALHEQVAATLERLCPDVPGLDAELAYHYARAGDLHAAKVVRHARAAGIRLLALFAYEDAARELSAALAALDRLPRDSGERARVLALLGAARSCAGDFGAARVAFHEAAQLAEATGDWQTLAQAALGFGGGTHFGGVWENLAAVDTDHVRLLEIALASCPPDDSCERVRLLGRLAQALYWSPDDRRGLDLSDEAVAIARRMDDPTAIAYALDSRSVVLWGPDHLDERRLLAEEMLRIGRGLEDHEIQLEALCWLITDALERGCIDRVDELRGEHARIAGELRQPYHLWFTETLRTMRAHLDGRLEEATELCERAYADGLRLQQANAVNVHLVQRLYLSLDQGRVEELLEQLARTSLPRPEAPVWRAAMALALAGLDRREEVLEQVGSLAEEGFAALPRDAVWMTTLVMAGRAVGHFDDPTYAEELYELLEPFSDRTCLPGGPVMCFGPVSRTLGMLARASGRPDDALAHLEDARERSLALGSPSLVARIQLDAARAHLLRGTDEDAAEAGRLLEEAAATASALGMRKLLHDVETLRASLGRGAPA
jgi:class 3 adenylate cyclase/tetratricopeptide (TPR) repeat protein